MESGQASQFCWDLGWASRVRHLGGVRVRPGGPAGPPPRGAVLGRPVPTLPGVGRGPPGSAPWSRRGLQLESPLPALRVCPPLPFTVCALPPRGRSGPLPTPLPLQEAGGAGPAVAVGHGPPGEHADRVPVPAHHPQHEGLWGPLRPLTSPLSAPLLLVPGSGRAWAGTRPCGAPLHPAGWGGHQASAVGRGEALGSCRGNFQLLSPWHVRGAGWSPWDIVFPCPEVSEGPLVGLLRGSW